jgi:hypothetical protein
VSSRQLRGGEEAAFLGGIVCFFDTVSDSAGTRGFGECRKVEQLVSNVFGNCRLLKRHNGVVELRAASQAAEVRFASMEYHHVTARIGARIS